MDTIKAFMRNEQALASGAKSRVFDWDQAARLIRERKPAGARAGLGDDWEWTGGCIFQNGDPITTDYTFLASNWAIPELDLDGEVIPCWRYIDETPGWDSDTKWPESALAILRG